MSALAGAEPIADYARRTNLDIYYGLYFLGKKSGWMHIRESNVKFRGKEAHLAETTRHIERRSGLFSQASVMEMTVHKYYELAGSGPILAADCRDTTDGRTFLTTLERHGKGMLLRRDGQKPRAVPQPLHNLRENQQLENWAKKARPGDRIQQKSISLEGDTLENDVVMRLKARRQLAWGGVLAPAYEMEITESGVTGLATVRPDGQVLKFVGGPMELRLEPAAVAKKLDASADLLAASSIPVNKNLGSARKIEQLQVRVSNLGDFQIPQSERQQVVKGDGQICLNLRRDSPEGLSETLSAADRSRFLRDDAEVSLTPRVRKLSRSIADPRDGDVLLRAAELQHWVYGNLQKTYSKSATNSEQVLENLAGDCTEHAILFVALARANGIPAREVGGLMYVQGLLSGSFAWHAWAEVYTGKRWVGVDPTHDENLIDATHIKMQRSHDDLAWLEVLGRLRLEILDWSKVKASGRPEKV